MRAEFTRLFAARRIEQWAERLQGNCFFTVGSILTAKNDRQVIDDFLDAVAVAGSGNTWPQLRLCRLLSDDRDADRKHTADELHSLLVQQPDLGLGREPSGSSRRARRSTLVRMARCRMRTLIGLQHC